MLRIAFANAGFTVISSPERAQEACVVDVFGVMPFVCPSPFAEPAEFTRLRAEPGPVWVRTATGDHGWLVSRYEDVKALGADLRIGRSHPDPARAPRLWDAALFTPQSNHETEMADHRRWRQALAPAFSTRRMQGLRACAQEILDGLLDEMIAAGPPADLHAALAEPFASRMVFEIIGIPAADHARMRTWSDRMRDQSDREQAVKAHAAITGYLGEQLAQRETRPSADALSDLVRARDASGSLTQDQMVEAASHLLFGGHETVAARITYGTLFLLAHPAQRASMQADPALVTSAVEEIMRLAVPGGSWLPRYALADITYGGVTMRRGDLVVFSVQSANRDEVAFENSASFDITRSPNSHVGFGHGKFFCLGASTARLELRTFFRTLFDRLPGLAAAVPLDQMKLHLARATGGLRELPVVW